MHTEAPGPVVGPGSEVVHAMDHLRHYFERLRPDMLVVHLLEDLTLVEDCLLERT